MVRAIEMPVLLAPDDQPVEVTAPTGEGKETALQTDQEEIALAESSDLTDAIIGPGSTVDDARTGGDWRAGLNVV